MARTSSSHSEAYELDTAASGPTPLFAAQNPRDNSPESRPTSRQHSDNQNISRVGTSQLEANRSSAQIEAFCDKPNINYYTEADWFAWVIILALCTVCALTMTVIAYTALGYQMAQWMIYPTPNLWWTWPPLSVSFTFWIFVLLVIACGDLTNSWPKDKTVRKWISIVANSVLLLCFLFQLVVFGVGLPVQEGLLDPSTPLQLLFVAIPLYVYLTLSAVRLGDALGVTLTVCVIIFVAVITSMLLLNAFKHWNLYGMPISR